MPPRAIFKCGLTLRMACAANTAISANLRQSGSNLKSQCDKLLGSFQSMTASIMIFSGSLESSAHFEIEYVVSVACDLARMANPCFFFRMCDDVKARTS